MSILSASQQAERWRHWFYLTTGGRSPFEMHFAISFPALQYQPSHSVNVPVVVVNSMQVIGQAHQFRVSLLFVGLPPNMRSHIDVFIRQSLKEC